MPNQTNQERISADSMALEFASKYQQNSQILCDCASAMFDDRKAGRRLTISLSVCGRIGSHPPKGWRIELNGTWWRWEHYKIIENGLKVIEFDVLCD